MTAPQSPKSSPLFGQTYPVWVWLGVVLLLLGLGGCTPDEPPAPAPTIAVIFTTLTPRPTNTPRPTDPPPPTLTPTATPVLETIVVYDDQLAPGWVTTNSQSTFVEEQSEAYVYDGSSAIKVVPRVEGSATFFVTLEQTAGQIYRKDDIIKLSFYLNPGPDIILPDDLAVTLQGSNELPYWSADDQSVVSGNVVSPFSETVLGFLGISRSIPPETWVLIELYPEDREFDPLYDFFTGFYIKNSLGFVQPFYIDRIELTRLVRPTDKEQP